MKRLVNWYCGVCGRVTSSGGLIVEIDGFRFLAFMMVFCVHLNHSVLGHPGVDPSTQAQGPFSRALELGTYGVQVFFVISGFILALPFAQAAFGLRNRLSMGGYYTRRLTRLEPPLIIHITFMLVLYVGSGRVELREMLPHYVVTLTYIHSHIFGYFSPLNQMTWSLEVEAQFYLLAPLFCCLYRLPSVALRRILFLALLVGLDAVVERGVSQTLLPVQLPYFLAGMLLADVFLTERQNMGKGSILGDATALIVVVGAILVLNRIHQMPLADASLALLIALFFASVFKGRLARRVFSNRFLATIGGMCYTFYLYI